MTWNAATTQRRGRRAHPEQDFHKTAVAYLRLVLRDDVVFFHIPNQGNRSLSYNVTLKAMGLLPGVFDLVLMWSVPFDATDGTVKKGLFARVAWAEAKADAGSLSEAQREFQTRVEALGHRAAVWRRLEDVEATLKLWGVPMRAGVTLNAATSQTEFAGLPIRSGATRGAVWGGSRKKKPSQKMLRLSEKAQRP